MTTPRASDDDLEREVAEIRRRARDAQSAIEQVRGQSNAENGAIAAAVDARGRLDGLSLSPQALRMTPTELAEAVADCVRRAQDQAADKARAIATAFADTPAISDALAAVGEFEADVSAAAEPAQVVDEDDHFDQLGRDPLGRNR